MTFWSWSNKMGLLKFSPSIHRVKLYPCPFLLLLFLSRKMIFPSTPFSLVVFAPLSTPSCCNIFLFLCTDYFSSDFNHTWLTLTTQNYMHTHKNPHPTFVHKFSFLLFTTKLLQKMKHSLSQPPISVPQTFLKVQKSEFTFLLKLFSLVNTTASVTSSNNFFLKIYPFDMYGTYYLMTPCGQLLFLLLIFIYS